MTNTNKERAEFEAHYFAENGNRLYCESQWRGWKARAAKAPAAPTQASPDGWKWMTHPSRNGGLPIPVRVFAEDGVTYYQPFSEADCEFEWESRDSEWHEAAPPAPTEQWVSVAERLPEPGNPVLLDIGKRTPIRAIWAAKHTVTAAENDSDWGEYDEASDLYYCPEGWYEWNQNEEVHWAVAETALHWQPMPAPPQGAAK